MADILLTSNSTPIFKYIVWVLGKIINIIFEFLYLIHIPNIGLAIVLFTIVIYMLMMPLTIKQQKFSKLSARMNPEIQAIQKKYKGKTDQQSMMAMNQETRAVYAKYGVSPSGSCLQLLIQLPVLFALYRVIYQMPAYVTKIRECFDGFVQTLGRNDIAFFQENVSSFVYYRKQFTESALAGTKYGNIQNSFIDVLNRASSSDWDKIIEQYGSSAASVNESLMKYNNFLGLNIGDSPSAIIRNAINSGAWLLVIMAVLIPILSAITQWVNIKLAPQPETNNNNQEQSPMMASMKTMNMIMPIMSAVFCYTLPAGMGIYWIASALVRTVQQIVINKHLNKIDVDEMMKKNIEKYNEKMKRMGLPAQQLNNTAKLNTRSVETQKPQRSKEEKEEAIKKATEYYNNNAKPGSLTAKANMVKQYNEKNNK
ncbi:MAG: YidC/Oxa1 family membrane protein insertase [Lachnospiraceae bacterium]|nr:YidC/Oxa1 family membrane protein insertase [Lachnospiraceae bacterium]